MIFTGAGTYIDDSRLRRPLTEILETDMHFQWKS